MQILFVLSCGIMFSHTLAYSNTDGYIQFPYFLKYGIAATWFLISFISTVYKGHGCIKKRYFKDIQVYSFPVLLMTLSVILSMILNGNYTPEYTMRSASNILVFLLTILAVYGCVNLFGKKTIKLCLYGLVLSTIMNVVYTTYLYGFSSVIYVLLNIVKASFIPYQEGSILAETSFSLEVADATFAYGFFFLYYLLFEKKSKERSHIIFLSIIGMYIGLKRVEIAAILIAIVIYKILIEKKGISRKKVQRIFLFVLLTASFLYLYLMKYHVAIFSFLDQSRINMYGRLRTLFELNPLYIGKGYGYVNKWLEEVSSLYYIMSVSHSDLARMYIELGMIGFICWLYYYNISLPNYFYRYRNTRIGDVVLCFVIVLMITYLIDNTTTLFATQFCFILIPIALAKHENDQLQMREREHDI